MPRPEKLSDEALVATVCAHSASTAAEIARLLGAGQSTIAKRLAALEPAGALLRVPGGRIGGVRVPDRWSASSVIERPDETSATKAEHEGHDAPEPARERADRLGRGQLAALVRDHLAAHPAESFGPAALGSLLGRSQGAVSNALASMAERGEVVLVTDHPRRYRVAR